MSGKELTTCLWFDTQGEEAARFYVSLFPGSQVGSITHYTGAGPGPEGSVMTVEFELLGQKFLALNGGPANKIRTRSTITGTGSPMAGRKTRAAG